MYAFNPVFGEVKVPTSTRWLRVVTVRDDFAISDVMLHSQIERRLHRDLGLTEYEESTFYVLYFKTQGVFLERDYNSDLTPLGSAAFRRLMGGHKAATFLYDLANSILEGSYAS